MEKIEIFDFTKEIVLTVDYTKAIDELVASGNYTERNKNINHQNLFEVPHKFIGKKVKTKIKFYHLPLIVDHNIISKAIQLEGFREANIFEFLTLGAEYPNIKYSLCTTGVEYKACYNTYKPCIFYRRRLGLVLESSCNGHFMLFVAAQECLSDHQ